jgi:hypothetical protein
MYIYRHIMPNIMPYFRISATMTRVRLSFRFS